jgi:glycosyltransferase involved in cell wall biosynthesis
MTDFAPTNRRIAHILCWPNLGGTEIATLRLGQALKHSGFSHLAFCAHHPSSTSRIFLTNDFEVIPYRVSELSLRNPLPYWASSLGLARAFRDSGVALVHGSDLLATYSAVLGARLARIPVVCHVRNPHAQLPNRLRHMLRLVTHFVFVSRHVRSHFAFGVAPGRGSVIYDGIEVADAPAPGVVSAVRAELGVPPGAKVVGMVARLAPQKDYDTFLRAAGRIMAAAPNTHFVVVGDHLTDPGAFRTYEALRSLIDALGITASVTFTGFRYDVPRLLPAFDVVVLATHFEGFGLSVLEAMAHGRPVVATAVGAMPELVLDDETGLLHRHADDDHLATQVLSLLRDDARAYRLGQAARAQVKRNFSRDDSSGHVVRLYNKLLRGG